MVRVVTSLKRKAVAMANTAPTERVGNIVLPLVIMRVEDS
jgi:hypothetical protein